MARRSPKDPAVSLMVETGCSWRLYRIFNFREAQAKRRLVSNSNRRHSNIHAIGKRLRVVPFYFSKRLGNGNSRSRPDVLAVVDEKHPHIDESSKGARDYGYKSISCVKVADQGNEATKMVVDQKFINGKYLCNDGAGSQSNQFFDALQILYSNKELFLKLLQDPNSVLAKQIYDLQNSQYQERQKRVTRSPYESGWNNSRKSNARQCGNPSKSSDRYILSCDPQSSDGIDTGRQCPLHSHNRFSYNAQTAKPSHFPFSRMKRKLRHAMGVRKKEQQWGTIDGVSHKFPCGCQGLEDGDKVLGMEESVGRNSPSGDHSGFAKGGKLSLDLKKRDKMIKIKDFTLCIGQEAVSVGESCGRNMNRTSVCPSEQNIQKMHVEARKNLSEMLNCRHEERKQWTHTQGRTFPLPRFESVPGSFGRDRRHPSVTEGMGCFPNKHHMVPGNKLWLQKEENSCFGSLGQNINEPPGAIVGSTIRKSPPDNNLHEDYKIPRGSEKLIKSSYDLHTREIGHMDVPSEQDSRHKDSPTRSFDMDITSEGIGSFMDAAPEIQVLTLSPEAEGASSSSSSCQSVEDPVNMRNRIEHPNTESVHEQFFREEVTNPASTISQPAVQDKFEEYRFADLVRSSWDVSDHVSEIMQAFSLKWDELAMKWRSPHQLLDPYTFDELKGLTNQLAGSKVLFDCVKEVFMEMYQNLCRLPPQISRIEPDVQAYVVKKITVNEVTEIMNLHHQHPSPSTLEQLAEKDLARRGSWLNARQINIEDIVIEVEEDVLLKLMLEIVYEMDIRQTTLLA